MSEREDWWQRRRKPGLRRDTPVTLPVHCPVCGDPLWYGVWGSEHAPNTAELNRIIPGGTYEYGNVEVICRTCNRRLQDSGVEELIQLLQHKLRQRETNDQAPQP